MKRLRKPCRRQIARVGFVHDDNARMPAQFPRQLAVTDIDGEDFFRAVLQQTIGETAGRSTQVNDGQPFDVQFKIFQGMFELMTAAADIFFSGFEFDLVLRPDRIARFTRRLPVDGNQTGHDSAPGLFPTFAQTAFHESLVEAWHVKFGVRGREQEPPAAFRGVCRFHAGSDTPDSALKLDLALDNAELSVAIDIEEEVIIADDALNNRTQDVRAKQAKFFAVDDSMDALLESLHRAQGVE